MLFNRPEAKYRAKMAMRGAYPHPMLVTLVFVLLTTVLTNVIMYFVSNPFSTAYLYLVAGEDVNDVYRYILTGQRVGIFLLVQLLVSLYLWVMQYGYIAYGLGLARRTGPSYHTLLEGFTNLGRALLVSFLTFLILLLWGLLGMVPGIIIAILGIVIGEYGLGLVVVGVLLITIGGVTLEIIMSYRYRMATFYLLDNPDMGVMEALSSSKEIMRGKKADLFIMDLSFLGWEILSVLTLGILGLWVTPYVWTSEANFYHWAVYGAFPNDQPQPGYQGSSYQSPYDDNKPQF